jgi:hypothetical protein
MADRVTVLEVELDRLAGELGGDEWGPAHGVGVVTGRMALRVQHDRLERVLSDVRDELRLVTLRERERVTS